MTASMTLLAALLLTSAARSTSWCPSWNHSLTLSGLALSYPPHLSLAVASSKLHTLQVNNAGMLPKSWTAQEFEQCIATNVAGPIQLAQQLLPHMTQRCAVVMVSSGRLEAH